jgi:hypothetical protein
MEIASYVFGAIFAAASLIAGLTVSDHRDFAIWTSCVALCSLVIATTCWYQDLRWKRDAAANDNAISNRDQRARILITSVACEPLTPEVEKSLSIIVKITNGEKLRPKKSELSPLLNHFQKDKCHAFRIPMIR